MDERPEQTPSHLFLVRLWQHSEIEGQNRWRGKLQHVVTGSASFFDDWPAMIALFTSMVPDLDSLNPPDTLRRELSSDNH